MPSEQRKQLLKQIELAQELYASLSSCSKEERPEIRAKIIEADRRCWEIIQSVDATE